MGSLCGILQLLVQAYYLLLLARALLSWIRPDPYNPIVRFIWSATEPLLAPFRRFVPPVGMFDVSFIVAFIVFTLVAQVILQLIGCGGRVGIF